MITKKTKAVRLGIFILVIVGIVVLMRFVMSSTQANAKYAGFAQCISDSGAKFYGAFWCPHCQAQKKRFGAAASALPYVECSTPDGKGQKQECTDIGIEGYPTWIYADGTKESGEVELADLATKTGCVLPE